MRSSILPFSDNDSEYLGQQLVDVDARGRMRIPVSLLASVDWWSTTAKQTNCLLVLDEPGRLSFLSWEVEGPRVLEIREELIGGLESEPDSLLKLRLMHDRYRRLVLPRDLRITLTPDVLSHLGIVTQGSLHVVRLRNRLELWATAYRDRQLLAGLKDLGDLP